MLSFLIFLISCLITAESSLFFQATTANPANFTQLTTTTHSAETRSLFFQTTTTYPYAGITNDECHFVKCNYTNKCILPNWVCDNYNDCGDNTDEVNCTYTYSSSTSSIFIASHIYSSYGNCYDDAKYQIKCNNTGECVWYSSARCNGVDDCGDNTDEKDCHKCVAPYEFKCATYDLCIPAYNLCNNFKDCSDNSDELNCPNATDPISLGPNGECYFVKCNHTNKCILPNWVCDNYNDCGDNSDEVNCTYTSYSPASWTTSNYYYSTSNGECNPSYQMKCNFSEICIPTYWICDGFPDCPDSADEQNCNYTTTTNTFTHQSLFDFDFATVTTTSAPNIPTVCSASQMMCMNARRCIPLVWKCDGDNDCGDFSDEQDCNASNTSTTSSLIGEK